MNAFSKYFAIFSESMSNFEPRCLHFSFSNLFVSFIVFLKAYKFFLNKILPIGIPRSTLVFKTSVSGKLTFIFNHHLVISTLFMMTSFQFSNFHYCTIVVIFDALMHCNTIMKDVNTLMM